MKVTKNKKALLSILIVLIMVLGSVGTVFPEASATQEWIGWLIDTDCVGANPKTHTQNCNLMPDCIASGEGIYVYTDGKAYNTYGSSDWLPFDEASQNLAKQLNSILSDPNNSGSYLTKYPNRIPTIKVTGYPVTSGLPKSVTGGDYGVYTTGIHITSIEFYYINSVSNYEVTLPQNVVLYASAPVNTATPTNTAKPTSTNTPTNTIKPTNTSTDTPTNTIKPTNTSTNTPTNTIKPTNTSTNTPTNTAKSTNTNTNTPTPANTSTPTNTTVGKIIELKGWLIDADCSGVSNPASHTTACLKMPSCLASGLGILVLQPDATYKFYKFDVEGHKLAEKIVFSTIKENNVTIAAEGSYNGEIFTVKTIYEDLNAPTPIPYQDIVGILYNTSDDDYGIKLEQPDGSYISYTLDEGGNKLINEQIAGKTSQTGDVLIKATGYFEGKNFITVKVQDYQEFNGWITTQKAFSPNTDPSTVTKQYLQSAENAAGGYGIAVKENNSYAFHPFDENGNKLAASVIKSGTDGKGVRILVNGHLDGNTINVYQALRERNILGILVTKSYFDEDRLLKNLTKACLLDSKNEASGYGYFVNSCGGYEFFPFDNYSHNLVKNVILNSKKTGIIKLNLKGFYYWRDRAIKVTEISEDTTPDTAP
ncbi:MAG: hypothetical protein Q8942_14190, partial [Bacillota bacterium]|nr:hypothetical protein [Bacillota bacterium]